MRRFQVEVEYILDHIDTDAIVEYISEKPHVVEKLLDNIDANEAMEYLTRYVDADTACQIIVTGCKCNNELLGMMDFSEIEEFYLANK